MPKSRTYKSFCNKCKRETNHFIRSEYKNTETDKKDETWFTSLYFILECCGCDNVSFTKKTHFSEHIDICVNPITGKEYIEEHWDEVIYPPATYRDPPPWFGDLPDVTLRKISEEIYKSLQADSLYLATFGSRTLIDRLIVLTVGDKGSFKKGLKALQDNGQITKQDCEILNPVIEAGNAAAHRGWAPDKEKLTIILNTVEGLIYRLLVLPALAEELEETVPGRRGSVTVEPVRSVTIAQKIETAPEKVRNIYDELYKLLVDQGGDVTVRQQKHYMAFRRNRNFASVLIYTQKRIVRIYLNLNPDDINLDPTIMRDARQIGHYGTGDLEINIKSQKDVKKIADLIQKSYQES